MRSVLLYDVASLELRPLVERLLAAGVRCIMNGTALRQELLAAGRALERWEDFQPADMASTVEREIERIANGIAAALHTPEGVRCFDGPGGNILAGSGQSLFEQALGMFGRQIALIETFERLRHARDVGLVVLGCDNNHLERTLVQAARRADIPSLQLAHGLNGRPRVRIAGEMHTLYADEVAVFGERARRNLIATGNAAERIHVTGAPAWDPLYAPDARIAPREARRRLGLDPERPVILFLPTCWHGNSSVFGYNVERFAETTRVLLGAIRERTPRAQLVIRPHPGERLLSRKSPVQAERWLRDYEAWLLAEQGVEARVIRDRKLEVVGAADVALAPGSSTVIPEIMILGRPVIRVRGWDGDDLYTEADGVHVVERDGIPDALARALCDSGARDAWLSSQAHALPELNFGNDGRAGERVAALILEKLGMRAAQDAAPRAHVAAPAARSRVLWWGAGAGAHPCSAELRDGLRECGIEVGFEPAGLRPYGVDLVHVFGSAHSLLSADTRVRAARRVWSPEALPWPDQAWVALALRSVYAEKHDAAERAAYLSAFADGSLEVEGRLRGQPGVEHQRALLELREAAMRSDHLCFGSALEAQAWVRASDHTTLAFSLLPPAAAVPTPVNVAAPPATEPASILCTEPIGPRGNQLLLVEALRGLDLPLVLAGPVLEPDYAELCRRVGGPRVVHLGPLAPPRLAEVRRRARCVVAPGFALPSGPQLLLAALESRPLALSHDHGQLEQLLADPIYCDPFCTGSIRHAVQTAIECPPERWRSLAARVAAGFGIEPCVTALRALYARMLGGDT